ncbi:MAG TPA: DUF1415 domain-containing protein [Chitinophaga sp.]|uniref:DUF1415 domain-containing protein n=1 Tax=Chitinophaga sp. TaxID=1869181 RepID=UPI002C133E9B|nr:DUF1415 domain-containing protein [Chitinophaga sp.]HVI45012.1 DUF1415 domain-containing protein [Chitinophaga sp.]
MDRTELIVAQTRKWIAHVVVGCNFCPFASRELQRNSIHYQVETGAGMQAGKDAFLRECARLDKDSSIATTLLIFPDAFPSFQEYLQLLSAANQLLRRKKYTGIYQVASFHPQYRFADSEAEDPADYTNRSPYPMLHILREADVRKAVKFHPDPEGIPARNVQFAREKGIIYMQQLYKDSF